LRNAATSADTRPEKINHWRLRRIRFRFVLLLTDVKSDLLWTAGRLSVDGFGGRLRGFRKSHHFVPAGPTPSGIATGNNARDRRARSVAWLSTDRKRKGRDGMSLLEGIVDSRKHPLAVVEDIAANHDWAFERSGEDEVTIVSRGEWTDYQLSFTWMSEIEALHLASAFDMKIPIARLGEVQRLTAAINEQLWIGHFDLWTQSGMIMHRQALVLPGGMTASSAQCEGMLAGAIHACERYYPAFQFVVWAGKSTSEAMAAAMFDTEGEA
jgi:hypothetical protein